MRPNVLQAKRFTLGGESNQPNGLFGIKKRVHFDRT